MSGALQGRRASYSASGLVLFHRCSGTLRPAGAIAGTGSRRDVAVPSDQALIAARNGRDRRTERPQDLRANDVATAAISVAVAIVVIARVIRTVAVAVRISVSRVGS